MQAWILDDTGGGRQQAAVEAGVVLLKCCRVFEMFGKTDLDNAARLLQQQAPHVLWINLFPPHTPRGNKQDRLGLRAVVRLMSQQMAQNRDVVLEAIPTNACLDMLAMQEIERDSRLTRNVVQWCALGICDDSGKQAADRKTVVITTLSWTDVSRCKCSAEKSHFKSLPAEQNRAVLRRFYQALVKMVFGTRPELKRVTFRVPEEEHIEPRV